jgi:lysophospholipase L1-like esterase
MRKILSVTLLSILLFLVLLEITLRIAGIAYTRYRHPENYFGSTRVKPGTYNILCLGDSFTEGSGATTYTGYPAQLERLLQKKGHKNMQVFNEGVCGATTSLLLYDLENHIRKYNPRVIIILSGVNNSWNFDKSSYFILKGRNLAISRRLEQWCSRLKTYKLMKLLWLNVKAACIKYAKFPARSNDETVLSLHEIFGRDIKNESMVPYEEALLDADRGDYETAEQNFKKAILIDNNNYAAHLGLAHVYQHTGRRIVLAEAELDQAIRLIDRFDVWGCVSLTYDVVTKVRDLEGETGLYNLKTHLQQVYTAVKAERPIKIIDMALDFLKDQQLSEKVFEYDITEVMRATRPRKISLVLQTYPQERSVNDTIRAVAKKFRLPLVDNDPLFKERLQHANGADFFVPDGHCNANGYRVMAEHVYTTLLREHLIGPPMENAK